MRSATDVFDAGQASAERSGRRSWWGLLVRSADRSARCLRRLPIRHCDSFGAGPDLEMDEHRSEVGASGELRKLIDWKRIAADVAVRATDGACAGRALQAIPCNDHLHPDGLDGVMYRGFKPGVSGPGVDREVVVGPLTASDKVIRL